MRIAVLDHLSAGGISRIVQALLPAVARLHPDWEIGYFVSEQNAERDRIDAAFAGFPQISVIRFTRPSMPPADDHTLARRVSTLLRRMRPLHDSARWVYRRFRRNVEASAEATEEWYEFTLPSEVVEAVSQYDVLYVAAPFWIEAADVGVATVATFHDFHYRVFPEEYPAFLFDAADRQIGDWLRVCDAVVTSTNFIAGQMDQFYPGFDDKRSVVYIAPYSHEPIGADEAAEVVSTFGLAEQPYAICAGSPSKHKNLRRLVEALAEIRNQGVNLTLVFTGHGTERIGTRKLPNDDQVAPVNDVIRAQHLSDRIKVLGYISNREVDSLMRGASLVVSPSLYEAASGPATDAWQYGVPVALSNIPPFVEQAEALGTRAWFFDALDSHDIANVMISALTDTDVTNEMVRVSSDAIAGITWAGVAKEYCDVFERAVKRHEVSAT